MSHFRLASHCDPVRMIYATLQTLFICSFLGCGSSSSLSSKPLELDHEYGTLRGKSVNGLNAFVEVLKSLGHEVRFANSVNQKLEEFADVIFRFSDRPGPPSAMEAQWYDAWLSSGFDSYLVYIPRDVDMMFPYCSTALQKYQAKGDLESADFYRNAMENYRKWSQDLPSPADDPVDNPYWFKTEFVNDKSENSAANWVGPWADGPVKWPIRETLQSGQGGVLLECSQGPVVVANGRRLFLANGAPMLNAGLVDKTLRGILERIILKLELTDYQQNVVILVGDNLFETDASENPLWKILTTWPMSLLGWHLILTGLALCWVKAIRKGPIRNGDRHQWANFSSHTRAVGIQLKKCPDFWHESQTILKRYAFWRNDRTRL